MQNDDIPNEPEAETRRRDGNDEETPMTTRHLSVCRFLFGVSESSGPYNQFTLPFVHRQPSG